MDERTGEALARGGGGLFERLMPATVKAREHHCRLAILFGVIALAVAALGIFRATDDLGLVLTLILAAVFALRAAWHAWQMRRSGPQEEYATRIEGLPAAERPAAFRHLLRMSAVVFPLFSAWIAWSLFQAETGRIESVAVWAPIALIYRVFGFWPAVLAVPGLGVLVMHGAWKKGREAGKAPRAAEPVSSK